MTSLGPLILIAMIVGFVVRNAKRPPAQRPGPGPRGKEAKNGASSDDAEEATGENCRLSHQGEASHNSREGLPASARPGAVHAFNRQVERARAAGTNEQTTVAVSRAQLNAAEMRRTVVMSEILSRPVSMRDTNE